MAGMWPIINPNKPLQLHTLLTMGSLLYLLAGCVLFQPSWATKQTKVDLRSTRLWLYLLCSDFCDIMSWTWDPNTDISDIYMFETYSLFHTYTTSNNSTLLPTIAFCSRARLLQGSSFKALSKSASQVNSSQEWTAQDVSQPSLLLIKAATQSHHVIRKMHGICLKTLTWHGSEGHELCVWNTLECIIPVAALARIPKWYPVSSGFHCYTCYSLWTFMRCLGKLIEKHETTTTVCGITGVIAAGFVHLNVRL